MVFKTLKSLSPIFLFLLIGCSAPTESLPLFSADEALLAEQNAPAPLLWEHENPKTKAWSQFLYQSLSLEKIQILERAQDLERFCPNYFHSGHEDRLVFWGMLISAIAKYESNFNPLERYTEKSMGLDPITGRLVVSEGLLQLSYQDITMVPTCNFRWDQDRHLKPTDPQKTILNPFINLDCGLKILSLQIQSEKKIVLSNRAYWAVLKSTYSENKIAEISGLTASLDFCH